MSKIIECIPNFSEGRDLAIHNVRILLPHTRDEVFIAGMQAQLDALLSESSEICDAIQQQVETG